MADNLESLMAHLKIEEGMGPGSTEYRHVAYLDKAATNTKHPYYDHEAGGVWTVGYGATGKGIGPDTVWDGDQANADLSRRVADIDKFLDRVVKVDLNENQRNALISLTYNVGKGGWTTDPKTGEKVRAGGIEDSNGLAALNAGDWDTAYEELFGSKTWKIKGDVNHRRRVAERAMWNAQPPATSPEEDPQAAMFASSEEIPFDPNDRGEIKQGFRHEFDTIPTQPRMLTPEAAEGLVASTSPAAAPAPQPEPEAPVQEADLDGTVVPPVTPNSEYGETSLVVPEGTPVLPTYDDMHTAELDAVKRAKGISAMDLVNAGFRNDNAIGVFAHGLNEDFAPSFEFDSQGWYNANKADIEALGGDEEEVGEILGRAVSEEHADYLMRKLTRMRDDEQMFVEAGLKGMALRLPSWMFDVDTLAAIVAPGLGGATKAGKLAAIVKAGTAAGLTNASIEAYAANGNPYRNGTDVALAGLSGLFLGGAIGGIVAPTRRAAEAAIVDDLIETSRVTMAHNLANDGNLSAAKRVLGSGRDPDGKLAPRSDDIATDIVDAIPEQKWAFEGLQRWINRRQFNLIGRTFFSKNDTVRKVSSSIMEGGLVDKSTARASTAEGRMHYLFQTSMANFYRSTLGDFRGWAEKNGYGKLRREVGIEAGERFYTDVARALKGDEASPEAVAAAGKIKPLLDEIAELARESGIPGFDNPVKNFFPRYWDDQKLAKLSEEVDRDTQGLWFKQALLNKWDEINPRPDTTELELEIGDTRAELERSFDRDFDAAGGYLESMERRLARAVEEEQSAAYYYETFRKGQKGIVEARGVFNRAKAESKAAAKELKSAQKKVKELEKTRTRALREFDSEAERRIAYAEADIPQSTIDELADLRTEVENLRAEGGSRLREAEQRLFDAEEPVNRALKRGSTREETAERIGKAFARAIARRHLGINDAMQRGLPLDDADRMYELFDGTGLDRADIDNFLSRVQESKDAAAKDGGNTRHGRARLHFDETLKIEVATKNGGTRMLSLEDMTVSDASKAIPRYLRTMSGWLGLAKESGIRGQRDINALLVRAAETGAEKDETDALKDAFNLITGRAIEADPSGLGSQASRIMTSMNYPRFGGSFGVAQLPEIGNPMGEVGILNFMREIPDANKLFKEAADGTLLDPTAREIDELFGSGTDYLINPSRSNFSVEDGVALGGKGRVKLDEVTQVAGRLTAITSFMAPVNAFLERVSTRAIMRDWGRFAKGKPVPEWKKARLRGAGLSDEMQARVFDQLDKKGTYKDDVLETANPHTWDDIEAADAYRNALDRERRMTIQRNDIGNTGSYIHKPVGRILTQFMNFMLNSINKQLVRGLHYRDIQTWTSWNISMFVGAMAYTAQTSIDYANDPKKRKERLEPKRIAAAAYQRAGFSAITVPLVDSALGLMGFDQWFNYGRTSALGTDFLTGNPSFTTAQDIAYTATLPLRLALNEDYEFSKEDTQRIQRMFPLQRTLGVKNGFHALDEALSLPSRQPQ